MLDAIDFGNHDATASSYWTLDPVDGTKGFLRRGQYAVSLALIEDGKVVAGVLGCPNLGMDFARSEIHTAWRSGAEACGGAASVSARESAGRAAAIGMVPRYPEPQGGIAGIHQMAATTRCPAFSRVPRWNLDRS